MNIKNKKKNLKIITNITQTFTSKVNVFFYVALCLKRSQCLFMLMLSKYLCYQIIIKKKKKKCVIFAFFLLKTIQFLFIFN